MSVEDVDRLLRESSFSFFLEEPPCVLRETLLEALRGTLLELDALDRGHPVWAYLAVQTVNASRLGSFVGWNIYHGLADERTYWTVVAQDLCAGSCVSTAAWSELEKVSRRWRPEWALLQGLFNFLRFSADRWLEKLKGFLVQRGLVAWALAYLRRPERAGDACVQWLAPGATPEDLARYAEVIEVVWAAEPGALP